MFLVTGPVTIYWNSVHDTTAKQFYTDRSREQLPCTPSHGSCSTDSIPIFQPHSHLLWADPIEQDSQKNVETLFSVYLLDIFIQYT